MESPNTLGSLASIVSLFATFYTLYKAANRPAAIRQHSREQQLSGLIDKIVRLPSVKATIPDSTAREIEALIKAVRLYCAPAIPFRQRTLKSLLTALEAELADQKQPGVIQHQLGLIRDEITIR